MSGNKVCLDTNIVLYLLGGDKTLADFLDRREIVVAQLAELELIGYPDITDAELKSVNTFLASCEVVPLSPAIRAAYVDMLRRYRLKLGDAVVAATARALGLHLMTADKGFE